MRDPFTLILPPAVTETSLFATVKMPRVCPSLPLNVSEPTVIFPAAYRLRSPPAIEEIRVENMSRFPLRVILIAAPEDPSDAKALLLAGPVDWMPSVEPRSRFRAVRLNVPGPPTK